MVAALDESCSMTAPRRFGMPVGVGNRKAFLQVQSQGRRFKGMHVVLLMASRPGPARVGFTVSRRVGHAVCRNRVRRRLKEIVRLHPAELLADRAYVFIAFPAAAGIDFATLQEEVLCLLQRAS